MLRIIGFDPGLAACGWADVEFSGDTPSVCDIGVFRTEKSARKRNILAADDHVRRARELAVLVRDLLRDDTSVICAESFSAPRHSSAAAKLSCAWGVIAAEASRLDIPIVQASPQAVKLAVTGSKTASKVDVQEALLKRFGASVGGWLASTRAVDREHGADALGSIVACLGSDVVRALRHRALASMGKTNAPAFTLFDPAEVA